jgi:hypothetical protein
MLTGAPSPSPAASNTPNVLTSNQQGTQLLSNPNLQSVPDLQARWRQGMGSPSGFRLSTPQPNFPMAGMGTGMGALSPNPMMVDPQQQAMIAALQGQR